MTQLKMHSKDLTQSNIEKIKALFPNCVTEAQDADGQLHLAVDFDLLRQELASDLVEGPQERYRLDWPGKREAMLLANSPIAKTLRPARGESVEFDSTENLFIEGDNLEALKLLQENYLGKVKMIYIDPPYNTGNDFVYNDDFAESSEEYFERSIQKDEEGNRLVANTESNGRYHSDWLSMMLPRLKLARNLLTEDGVIFISIDDGELENLKKVCDEVFGAENFINIISTNLKNVAGASGGGEDRRLKKNIEYILIYAKAYQSVKPFCGVYNYSPIGELVQEYRDEGISWKYTSVLINSGDKVYIGSTTDGAGDEIKIFERVGFEIKSIAQICKDENISEQDAYDKYGCMAFQTAMPQSSIRPRVMEKVTEVGINSDLYSIEYIPRSGRNKGQLYEQFYKGKNFRLFAWLRDVAEEIDGHLYKKDLQGTYWDFVSATKNLSKEGGMAFPNGKKPVSLLKRMIQMMGDSEMTVVDFFSGSGSTAHAVLEANSEDGGKRKFIMVQIPESVDEKNEAFAEGWRTISALSMERIRRAGAQILEGDCHEDWNKDIGFRVLKVDTSNMKDVYYRPAELTQHDLANLVSPIKADRSSEDLLFQVMLDLGLELNLPIHSKTLHGKEVFFVANNRLIACFEPDISEELLLALTEYQPLRVVFADTCFGNNDSLKTNAKQIFKQRSSDTSVMGF